MQSSGDGIPGTAHPEVRAWFDRFTQAVRLNDIDAGLALFDAGAIGYGTKERRAAGLGSLAEHQWRPTWRRIRSWTVDEVDVVDCSESLAVLAFTWTRENDDSLPVSGRATLALRRFGTDWRCIHSHFSVDPQVSPEGYW